MELPKDIADELVAVLDKHLASNPLFHSTIGDTFNAFRNYVSGIPAEASAEKPAVIEPEPAPETPPADPVATAVPPLGGLKPIGQ